MTSKVLCKYYLNGCCAFGDECRFSHNKQDQRSEVCKYYLAGCCSYGENCRYDHTRPDWHAPSQQRRDQLNNSSYQAPQLPKPQLGAGPAAPAAGGHAASGWHQQQQQQQHYSASDDDIDDTVPGLAVLSLSDDYADANGHFTTTTSSSSSGQPCAAAAAVTDPADIELCSEFTRSGRCRRGEACRLIHGTECSICGKMALHPYNPEASEQHILECSAQIERNSRREADKQVECCICLESVLGKPAGSGARRFGLLGCNHAFCLSCIRNWRSTDAADIDSAVRTCPVCRGASHFVTPSTVWPHDEEEKQQIVSAYKSKLAETDCMHFDYGEGRCPFGTSCFYRHAYKDGTLEVRQLRLAGTADGGVAVIAPVSLASFLDTPSARRALQGAPRSRRTR